ncbi:MAG: restriction endonuclease subunit S [Bacteroidales bacterium]|nr:restriction endonuclease subunit S [Bacteroidales bacterium]
MRIFFSRGEFDRYTRFHSWGSARETFGIDDMREVKIPIPDIAVQQAVVDIYDAYLARREINERLKAQIKDLCPILIKGSLEEASA